jgi:hypothetical protein
MERWKQQTRDPGSRQERASGGRQEALACRNTHGCGGRETPPWGGGAVRDARLRTCSDALDVMLPGSTGRSVVYGQKKELES